ncbi:MAG: Peptidyl-prolyl cis-trans isomerase [Parcubacteria group bacterium GW2011_GWE2_37_8]|nr:MAG: Peptidyl-prolyl cis-trans isomerase [Parcubacteria group bacterium GW2011_GWE2_37_8]
MVLALVVWYFGFYRVDVASQPQLEPENINKMSIVILKTNLGDIKVELFEKDAPKTVANFVKLSKEGFYNGTRFHRVIKDFMIQGGDPNSKDDNWSNDGMGDPGYKFEDEFNSHKLVRGVIAMANSGPNTNGSQFFIVTAKETPWLDGKHTAFGKVIEGMDVIDKVEALKTYENDNPRGAVTVEQVIVE